MPDSVPAGTSYLNAASLLLTAGQRPDPGDDFIVLYSEAGDILLRPIRTKNRSGLIKGLRTLRGLKLEERVSWEQPVRDISL